MTDALQWIAVLLTATVVILVVSVVALRAAGPHSRKMAEEQNKLNRKARAPEPSVAAASTAKAAVPESSYRWGRTTAALFVAALAVFYFLVYQKPEWSNLSASELYALAWDRWWGIIALAGILWLLIELNAARLGGAARVMRILLLGGVLVIFIGSLILSRFTPTVTASAAQAAAANVSSGSSAPSPIVLHIGPAEESQRVPVPYQFRVVIGGTDFQWNCYYGDGHKETVRCRDGNVVEVSVTNLKKDADGKAVPNTIVVSYRNM